MSTGMTPFVAKYRLEQELRPFTADEVRELPRNRSGLYALWLPSGIEGGPERLYLGMSTTCLRRRLLQHLSNEINPGLRRQLRIADSGLAAGDESYAARLRVAASGSGRV